jgi:hypothetical protein
LLSRKFPPARNPRPRARVGGQARVFFCVVDFLSFRFFHQASDFRTWALARLASHRQAHPDGWSRTRSLSQVSNSPTQHDLKSQVAASTTQQPDGIESSRVMPGPLESQLTTHKSPDSSPGSSRCLWSSPDSSNHNSPSSHHWNPSPPLSGLPSSLKALKSSHTHLGHAHSNRRHR